MDISIRLLAFGLAEAFLRGAWEPQEMAQRGKSIVVPFRNRRWITRLAQNAFAAYPSPFPPLETLIRFLEQSEDLIDIFDFLPDERLPDIRVDLSRLSRPVMQPSTGAAATWAVRPLVTEGEVADWLGLTSEELDWFAGHPRRTTIPAEGPLQHYRYQWIAKTAGGSRLLEIPKQRLKQIQRQILGDVLNRIPPHPAAHAFRTARSVASYVAPHTSKQILLHIDLREFFPSVRSSQVHALFRTAGYPGPVASLLTRLCTNRTPRDILQEKGTGLAEHHWRRRYELPHLPQGAPTSPALANLAAFWLDCRLSGLARKVGAHYTRYADDLLFSGGDELADCMNRFRVLVAAIAMHEGFEIRLRKTRVMHRDTRQQVAGIIVNQHPNIPRKDFDTLRAILHNCHRYGPASQNRENHPMFREQLQGKIAYWKTICPTRAGKLESLYAKIDWSS